MANKPIDASYLKSQVLAFKTKILDPLFDKKQNITDSSLTTTAKTVVGGINELKSNLDKVTTYSTDEQIIGTWLDGSTLYKKTIIFDTTESEEWVVVTSTNDITPKRLYGYATLDGEYECLPINAYENDTYRLVVIIDKNRHLMYKCTGWEDRKCYCTIEYTK